MAVDQLGVLDRMGVFDTYIHVVDSSSAASILAGYLEDRRPRQIVTVNTDFLRISEALPQLRDVINDADLAVADGVPLVWLARYLGLKGCGRITGPDLVNIAARLSIENGARLFFLGGTPEAADGTRLALSRVYPGVNICGTYSPPLADYPFPSELDEEIVARVRDAAPDILFVGFGCPKQDLWIKHHMETLGVPISVGVGGTFNFFSGLVPRAPVLMQQSGLEWVYRLWTEPRRLWRRYLAQDLPFMLRLLSAEASAKILAREERPLSYRSMPDVAG